MALRFIRWRRLGRLLIVYGYSGLAPRLHPPTASARDHAAELPLQARERRSSSMPMALVDGFGPGQGLHAEAGRRCLCPAHPDPRDRGLGCHAPPRRDTRPSARV